MLDLDANDKEEGSDNIANPVIDHNDNNIRSTSDVHASNNEDSGNSMGSTSGPMVHDKYGNSMGSTSGRMVHDNYVNARINK